MDSSAARGIITRQGVGRVKHLQIRTLFLQDLHKQGTISVHPVGTKEDTAGIGTKPLSAKRIKLLLHWLGFQTGDNEPVGREELQEHRSQAQAKAAVRHQKQRKLRVAALLFSGIAAISEGFWFQESFQELQEESFQKDFQELQEESFQKEFQELQEESFRKEFQELSVSVASACEQDGMRADTSACALGTQDSCDMSACAVGSGRVCKGTVFSEMLSHLRGRL